MGPPRSTAVLFLALVACTAAPGTVRDRSIEPEREWFLDDEIGIPSDLAITSEGHLAAVMFREDQIVFFDLDGTILRQVGRTGSGPLEFRRASEIECVPEGLVVDDGGNARLQVLDEVGALQRIVTLNPGLTFRIGFGAGWGGIYFGTGGMRPGGLILQYGMDGNLVREIGDLEAEASMMIDGREIREYALRREVHPRFRSQVLPVAAPDGGVLAVHVSLPMIRKFDAEGDEKWLADLDLEEFEGIVEANYLRNLNGPEYQGTPVTFWRSAAGDGEGGCFLLLAATDSTIVYHVDASGRPDTRYLGPVGPPTRIAWRDGWLWVYERATNRMRGYRITG